MSLRNKILSDKTENKKELNLILCCQKTIAKSFNGWGREPFASFWNGAYFGADYNRDLLELIRSEAKECKKNEFNEKTQSVRS
jgi:hypothetical protein